VESLLDRLAEQVGDRKLAINLLRKRGHMEKDSELLTPEGADREWLGRDGRAKNRAVKLHGGCSADYKYDHKTNRAKRR